MIQEQGSTSTRAAQLAESLRSDADEIAREWEKLLLNGWKADPALKLELLKRDMEASTDPLSLLIRALERSGESDSSAHLPALERVLNPKYSIVDFQVELECLQTAAQRVLFAGSKLPPSQLLEDMIELREELASLLRGVLRETSEIYEQVLESGVRGFCRVDQTGRIVFANAQFLRLTGREDLINQQITTCFRKEDARAVLAGLQNPKPILQVLYLRTGNGGLVPVAAELAALIIDSEARGSYAYVGDISGFVSHQVQILDRSPLGIGKLNLDHEFTYANPSFLKMLGATSLEGKRVGDVLADDGSREEIEEQLQKRKQGESSTYNVTFKRVDNGRRVPVELTAMPETDADDNICGSVGIVRNVLREQVAEKINRAIATSRTSRQLLELVAIEIRRILPIERFTVSLYTDDLRYVRPFFVCESFNPDETTIVQHKRWWEFSEAMQRWSNSLKDGLAGNLEDYLALPAFEHLRSDPMILALLRKDLRSVLSRRITAEGRVVASVSCNARGTGVFNNDDLELLKSLPLDQAVLMALFYDEREDLNFRLDLLKTVAVSSNNLNQISRLVVDKLADHYEWANVAMYHVDESRQVFRLLSQRTTEEAYRLKPDFTQPLTDGVLGYCYREKKDVIIGDVRKDALFKDIFLPMVPGSVSEMCLPIISDQKVKWLLNVEDTKESAFAPHEKIALAALLNELAALLARAGMHYLMRATLESASDAVIVTENDGTVRQAYAGTESLFGVPVNRMIGTHLQDYLEPKRTVDALISVDASRTEQVTLARNGESKELAMSVSSLPEPIGGKVFIAKDMLPIQQEKQLRALDRLYAGTISQVKTPLSIAFAWIDRMRRSTNPQETTDLLRKIERQLRQVELTYDRVFLAATAGRAVSYNPILLDPRELIECVHEDVPESVWNSSVSVELPSTLPLIKGDLFQLSFCLRSTLTWLLRFAPESHPVRLSLASRGNSVAYAVSGRVPEADSGSPSSRSSPRDAYGLATALADLDLGAQVIRTFIRNHGGTFHENRHSPGQITFEFLLPVNHRR